MESYDIKRLALILADLADLKNMIKQLEDIRTEISNTGIYS